MSKPKLLIMNKKKKTTFSLNSPTCICTAFTKLLYLTLCLAYSFFILIVFCLFFSLFVYGLLSAFSNFSIAHFDRFIQSIATFCVHVGWSVSRQQIQTSFCLPSSFAFEWRRFLRFYSTFCHLTIRRRLNKIVITISCIHKSFIRSSRQVTIHTLKLLAIKAVFYSFFN